MGPTRRERTEAITKLRRQQILDAALDIFSRKGFNTATTAEIAKAAGVAEGTIFNYFPSKRELFVAVIKEFVITSPLLDLIDKLPQGDIAGTFKLILKERFQLIESGIVSRVPILIADVIRDPELKAICTKEFLQPFLEKMEAIYRMLHESGIYRDIDPPVAVRAFGGMIFGFVMFKSLEGDASPLQQLPQDKVTNGIIDLLLHGVLDTTGSEENQSGRTDA